MPSRKDAALAGGTAVLRALAGLHGLFRLSGTLQGLPRRRNGLPPERQKRR